MAAWDTGGPASGRSGGGRSDLGRAGHLRRAARPSPSKRGARPSTLGVGRGPPPLSVTSVSRAAIARASRAALPAPVRLPCPQAPRAAALSPPRPHPSTAPPAPPASTAVPRRPECHGGRTRLAEPYGGGGSVSSVTSRSCSGAAAGPIVARQRAMGARVRGSAVQAYRNTGRTGPGPRRSRHSAHAAGTRSRSGPAPGEPAQLGQRAASAGPSPASAARRWRGRADRAVPTPATGPGYGSGVAVRRPQRARRGDRVPGAEQSAQQRGAASAGGAQLRQRLDHLADDRVPRPQAVGGAGNSRSSSGTACCLGRP